MRIYTQHRIDSMTPAERQDAIDAVKSSNTLSIEEKEANLLLLESEDSTKIAHMQLRESAADISDICS